MKNGLQLTMVLASIMTILAFHKSRLTEEFQASLDQGKIKVVENVNYLRKEVGVNAGTVQLLDANTAKIKGVSDFDKNILAANSVQVITELRVGYDASQATTGKEAVLPYATALSPSVRSARLVIKQAGAVLFSMPISDLNNPNSGTNTADEYTPLAIPLVLVGGVETEFDIEFPVGATAHATNKEYFELAFKGYETRRSAA